MPLPQGSPVCMAVPVHMVAGMASVHLHPAGILPLDPDAQAQLQAQFSQEFGAREQALWAVGDGLLLAAPEAAAASAADPARMLGNPVVVQRSPDPTLQALRRLGVEVEMWLASLALNREREGRNELAITALWFWGGGSGELPDTAKAPIWEQAFGGDPWLHGLWRRLTDRQVMAAQSWDELTGPSAVVVASAARKSLAQLESDWFVPALRDLHAGRMSSLVLRIGGQRWDLGVPASLALAFTPMVAGAGHMTPHKPIRTRDATLARQLPDTIPPLLRRIYAARGITGPEQLITGLEALLPVSGLEGVERAADLLLAHQAGRVLVVGDFDADGATSTALVVRALSNWGFQSVDFLVPDRFKFGYGLTPGIVAEARTRKPTLIVTVDNGSPVLRVWRRPGPLASQC